MNTNEITVSVKENNAIETVGGDSTVPIAIAKDLNQKKVSFKISSKFLPNSYNELRLLFSNSIWLLMSLTTVMEQSIVQACTTYISKFLQIVFNVPANHASYVVGCVVVPGAIAGVLFGGLLMHRFQPSQNTAIKGLIFIISTTGILTLIVMFLGCDDLHVAGVSINYNNVSSIVGYDLNSDCNRNCHCTIHNYEPVCNVKESKNYYSPCYAGCKFLLNGTMGTHSYRNCECSTSETLSVGKCAPNCPTYYITLVLVFFQVFLTATGQIPVNIVTLRSVSVKQSSMALGVQVFMVRLLAFIPVPLYFGALFDHACRIRVTDECTKGSVCHEYDLSILPFIWLGTIASIKLINFILIVTTYICMKKQEKPVFIAKVSSTNLFGIQSKNANSNNTEPTSPIIKVGAVNNVGYYPNELERYFSLNTVEMFYGYVMRRFGRN